MNTDKDATYQITITVDEHMELMTVFDLLRGYADKDILIHQYLSQIENLQDKFADAFCEQRIKTDSPELYKAINEAEKS